MARTFTRDEFQIALDRAVAQKLAEEAGSDEDDNASTQGDGQERIGTAALGLMSKKRKHDTFVEEIFESSGSSNSSSSSSSQDHKRIAVVAKTDIKCAGTNASHFLK